MEPVPWRCPGNLQCFLKTIGIIRNICYKIKAGHWLCQIKQKKLEFQCNEDHKTPSKTY